MNLEGNNITSMPLKLRFKPQKLRYAKTQLSLFPDTMQSDIVSDFEFPGFGGFLF